MHFLPQISMFCALSQNYQISQMVLNLSQKRLALHYSSKIWRKGKSGLVGSVFEQGFSFFLAFNGHTLLWWSQWERDTQKWMTLKQWRASFKLLRGGKVGQENFLGDKNVRNSASDAQKKKKKSPFLCWNCQIGTNFKIQHIWNKGANGRGQEDFFFWGGGKCPHAPLWHSHGSQFFAPGYWTQYREVEPQPPCVRSTTYAVDCGT